MKNKYFYTICISFVAGVMLATFFDVPSHFALVTGVATCAVFIFAQFVSREKIGEIIFLSLSLCMISLGVVRYDRIATLETIPEIESSLGQKIEAEGIIHEEPELSARSLRFAIAPEKIDGKKIHTKTKILVSADRYANISYGDRVTLTGKVIKPENFSTDGGAEFDYVSYLEKDAIAYVMKNPIVKIISRGNGSKIISGLLFIKHAFASSIDRVLPAPENMFANGLLIGTRSSLPQSLTDAFVKTGTIHMVALSGYNVTIVVQSIMSLVAFLPIGIATGIGVVSIIFFALLVGGGSTVVRASIMASVLVLSKYIGRNYDVARALVLAGAVMIAINPKILIYDSSFQLSFLATLGMLYLSPKIFPYLRFVPVRFKLREIAAGTFAAELSVFPLIVYKTGMLSLVSIPTNMLVLPLIPLTMLSGFFTGAIGLLSHVVATPFAFVSYALLHYELCVVQWFASLPFSAVSFRHVSVVLIIVWYAGLAWWIMRKEKSSRKEALQN